MKKLLACISTGIASIILISLLLSTPQKTTREINVWHKVSTDEANPGVIVSLDMSRGYTYCEGGYIFLVLREVGTEESTIIVFPNGGYWETPKQDPFFKAMEEEFNSLEEYLKDKDSQEIKKK